MLLLRRGDFSIQFQRAKLPQLKLLDTLLIKKFLSRRSECTLGYNVNISIMFL